MKSISFSASIAPVPFMRAIPTLNVVNPKRYRQFKTELGWFARLAMHGEEPLQGLLRLYCHFYKNYRNIGSQGYGDVDNFTKAVMDALQGICYTNDAQIIEIHGFKHYDKKPRIEIELEELLWTDKS